MASQPGVPGVVQYPGVPIYNQAPASPLIEGTGAPQTSPVYVAPNNTAQKNTVSTKTSTTPVLSAADQATITQYNQAIDNTNAAINRLPGQLNSGISGIDSSYQNALAQLLGAKNQGEQTYDQSKQTNATNFVGAKNTIGADAGDTLNSLRRLLGSRGAGGGSAYNISAPEAVAGAATTQRAGAGNSFAQNQQGLDQNWGQYLLGYNNQVSSAGNQRDQQKQSLQGSIDTNRATLLQSLAQLQSQRDQASGGNGVNAAQPYLDQANALLDKTANYTTNPIAYQTQAYQAPALASYDTTAQATPQYSGGAGGSDYFSPYLAALLGKKQQGAV